MSYQIADEPTETSLGAYVVRPTAPLLAAMVCGSWLAWPWFAFNAIAMGSPTKRKELLIVAGAFVGTAVLAMLVIFLARGGYLPPGIPTRLAVLGIVTFKLSMTYYMSVVQERTFHVYEYYGGSVRNAGVVISLGYYLRSAVIGVSDDPLWIIIVAGGI
ncbi:MAG: hypothetical protein H0T46_22340 [Deltaproteobacteria bacterium]|nr:hypothetical protein [Deltaproteobacteria bacterium]